MYLTENKFYPQPTKNLIILLLCEQNPPKFRDFYENLRDSDPFGQNNTDPDPDVSNPVITLHKRGDAFVASISY